MNDVYTTIDTRVTPQTSQADPRHVENNAGGFTFTVTPLDQFRRFLILGSEGGTYYVGERELTADNAKNFAGLNVRAAVDVIAETSLAGRAPKQNPTLFALAYFCSVKDTSDRQYALHAVPKVVRTGTHLFLFVKYLKQFRGWGRAAKRAVAQWYTSKSAEKLAYQMLKYKSREGYTHRDVLRLAHPVATTDEQQGLFQWAVGKGTGASVPKIVTDVEHLLAHPTVPNALEAITSGGMSWEMLPTEVLNSKDVWETLLDTNSVGYNAIVRQLPRLTTLDVSPRKVLDVLGNEDVLLKSRMHPINILNALVTYQSGRSFRGGSSWSPNAAYEDALDKAFYTSFGAVEPAYKRTMIALDVSDSMGWANIAGMNLTPAQASAAMALVTASTESDYTITAFSGQMVPVAISPRQRLDDVNRMISRITMGRTDCALPMIHALQNRIEVDTFVVYTDNETWFGSIHPHQALKQYQNKMGINARLVVVAMTPTRFSIADPTDAGMLDIAGFDSATPQLISDFSAGR